MDVEVFLMTGDIGYIDEKGCLFIVDRKKEVMLCKGYQIHTSEIENIIEAIDGVEAVAVVGIPNEIASNLLAAVIVKWNGFQHLSEQFIKDFVAEKLLYYKHLDAGVYFVDKLPVTPSGKVKKNLVVDIVKRESLLKSLASSKEVKRLKFLNAIVFIQKNQLNFYRSSCCMTNRRRWNKIYAVCKRQNL